MNVINSMKQVLLHKRVIKASQEIPCLLWDSKFNERAKKLPIGPYPEPDEKSHVNLKSVVNYIKQK
jgi:hypothetical protein